MTPPERLQDVTLAEVVAEMRAWLEEGWEAAQPPLRKWIADLEAAAALSVRGEPVAMRYSFDGYGWRYIDNGSGSDWQTRHADAEPLYAPPPSEG